ncbi:hypothetical protein EUTSA_v10027019mg [Eutrema salsugineum]|uniref:Uncharacterized protein n=1 Tax=Eutrema salsugineum TaxID=72664 RepID=V4MLG7_EUTSA|nr:hypothetical protein EUTSA_v10027019mg [Eutrema salsugineum]
MGDKEKQYSQWTPDETKVLIELLVEGIQRGWRDSGGGLMNKATVEHKILPVLNERLGCQKTHKNYLSQIKSLKSQYQNYVELLRFSSGFGWDPVMKRFTAPDEVWCNYLKLYLSHLFYRHIQTTRFMRYDSNDQFEDLKILFDCSTANGSFSVGLGETTDARTYSVDNGQVKENLNFDESNDDGSPLSSQKRSPLEYDASPFSATNLRARAEKLIPRKRSRTESFRNSDELNSDSMIAVSNKILSVIQQREERQQKEAEQREEKLRLEAEKREVEKKKNNVWDAMKEVPNLNQSMKFKAVTLIYSLGMKDVFTDMSPEERFGWIQSNISSE